MMAWVNPYNELCRYHQQSAIKSSNQLINFYASGWKVMELPPPYRKTGIITGTTWLVLQMVFF